MAVNIGSELHFVAFLPFPLIEPFRNWKQIITFGFIIIITLRGSRPKQFGQTS